MIGKGKRERRRKGMIAAFGEQKTLSEWAQDPRCVVPLPVLADRFHHGMGLEEALTRGTVLSAFGTRPKRELIRAFGQEKSASQWAMDARCTVSANTIQNRIKRGMSPERAISSPDPRPGLGSKAKALRGSLLEAFGETKRLAEWLDDPRREVPRLTVTHRLKNQWTLADAMTIPIGARKGTGRPATKLLSAFGELKSVSDWAADPRAQVGKATMERRISKGWDVERAISEPRYPADHTKGKRRRDSRARFLTAFGETKTAMDWADDPRCMVSADRLGSRLRQGWTDEDAITLPVKLGGPGHTGKRAVPKNSPPITAWGETKALSEWPRDPRARATNDQIGRRIKKGWSPEEAISRPTLPRGYRREDVPAPATDTHESGSSNRPKGRPGR